MVQKKRISNSFDNLNKILGEPDIFLKSIFRLLGIDKIDVDNYELDHICYRTESVQQYFELRNKLNKVGEILAENEINGRTITTFQLYQPIVFESRKILLLELPSPKFGSYYSSGFEHVEFVIDERLDQFISNYPHVRFDKNGMSKNINPDVRVKYGDLSVKFHLNNLKHVIQDMG